VPEWNGIPRRLILPLGANGKKHASRRKERPDANPAGCEIAETAEAEN
jgi:hypothetical protein